MSGTPFSNCYPYKTLSLLAPAHVRHSHLQLLSLKDTLTSSSCLCQTLPSPTVILARHFHLQLLPMSDTPISNCYPCKTLSLLAPAYVRHSSLQQFFYARHFHLRPLLVPDTLISNASPCRHSHLQPCTYVKRSKLRCRRQNLYTLSTILHTPASLSIS